MSNEPLAYFITWTTYGTWLPGDERGWWKEDDSQVQLPDRQLVILTKRALSGDIIVLSEIQRAINDTAIRAHCELRQWILHECNVRTNHVHIVLTAVDYSPETVREQLKAKGSCALSDHAAIPRINTKNGRRKWWTEKGNIRRIWDEESLAAAIAYVRDQ